MCFVARRRQQYFVSKNAEWLEQEISSHIKVTAKTYETEYEMPCISFICGRLCRLWVVSVCVYM